MTKSISHDQHYLALVEIRDLKTRAATVEGLLAKIIHADFAEFRMIPENVNDVGLGEGPWTADKTQFAIDTGWFQITREERMLLEELLGRSVEAPPSFVASSEG